MVSVFSEEARRRQLPKLLLRFLKISRRMMMTPTTSPMAVSVSYASFMFVVKIAK